MNLRIYEYLLAIAEEKNITRAAEKMFISQPAMSQQVHKFEKEWNITMFESSRDGLIPTKEGRIVLETAQQVQAISAQVQEQLESLRKSKNHEIRIYIEYVMYNMFLRDIWPKVLAVFPDVRLNLTTGDSRNARAFLQQETADIVIASLHDEFPLRSFSGITFSKEEYMLTASAKYYDRKELQEMLADPESSRPHKFFLKGSFSLAPTFQETALQESRLPVSAVSYTSTHQNAARALSEGRYLSFLPDLLFAILDLPVVRCPLREPFYVYTTIAWRKDQELNEVYRLIAQLLQKAYAVLEREKNIPE